MNIPPYDDTDLSTDLYLKYRDKISAEMLEDITTTLQLAFGDGYCRGYNSANEWYTEVDGDIEYIKSFDNDAEGSGYLVDTFNDDLVGDAYGDVPNIQDLNEYDNLFSRRNKNE